MGNRLIFRNLGVTPFFSTGLSNAMTLKYKILSKVYPPRLSKVKILKYKKEIDFKNPNQWLS